MSSPSEDVDTCVSSEWTFMLGGKKSCLCWLLFSRLRPWEPLPPSCCSSLSQKNESNAQMLPCDCFKNAARQVRSKATPPQHSTIARQCSDIGLATGCAKPAGTAGRATTSTEEDFACGWCHSWHPLHWLRIEVCGSRVGKAWCPGHRLHRLHNLHTLHRRLLDWNFFLRSNTISFSSSRSNQRCCRQ